MPTVYVVNDSGHDFSSALDWGDEIKFMSEGRLNRYAINQMYRVFSEALADSEPDDYILATGLTQMNQVAAAIFARMHGTLNLLIYKDGGYVERKLVLDKLLDMEGEDEPSSSN